MIQRLKTNSLFWGLLVVLVGAQAIIHRNWIFSLAPLVSGDWQYFYRPQLLDWFPLHPFWINYDSLGRSISQGNFVFLFSVFGWVAKLGAGYEVLSRLFFFIPVLVLTPLGTFLALKELVKEHKLAALGGTFVYTLNTYFVVIQGGHMHLCMTYALAPFVYYFASNERGGREYFWMFIVICVMGLYDIRMTLLVSLLAAAIALFHKVRSRQSFLRYVRNMVLIGIGFIVFNSFWIIPKFFTQASPFSRNVFAQDALNWVTQTDAFTLHHPFWSGEGVTDFIFQNAMYYMLALPIIAFLPFALSKVKRRNDMFFYGVIALASMLLLIQENSIIGELYRTVYTKVPLMSMFRESTKIFFITSFTFSVLIAFLIAELIEQKRQRALIGVLSLLILVLLIPIKPYLTGRFVKAYKQEPIPEAMHQINKTVIQPGQAPYRNLWISRTPKFASATIRIPNIDALELSKFWGKATDPFSPLGYLESPSIRGLLNFAGIRHVAVPNDTIGAGYQHYDNQPAAHYKRIVERWNLPKVHETEAATVWRNDSPKPHMYFSTQTVAVDSLGVFSGIDENPTAAYIFRDQNQTFAPQADLSPLIDITEINALEPRHIQIFPNRIISSIQPPQNTTFKAFQSLTPDTTPITSTNTPITINVPELTGKNLFNNGSFEDPTKTPAVFDANNYDKTSPEQNGITSRLTNDAVDGSHALEIRARHHIAGLSQKIAYDPQAHYLIQFDYKHLEGPTPRFGLYPFMTEPENRQLTLDAKKTGIWSTQSLLVRPGQFRDELHFVIYLPTKNGQESKLLVDNIRIYQLPFVPQFYLRTIKDERTAPDYKIKSSAPTRYSMHVSRLDQPRLFVFSETYDPNWKLFIKRNGQKESFTERFKPQPYGWSPASSHHVITNGFANGWWLDPAAFPDNLKSAAGEYELILEYAPQRWAHIGTQITGGLIAGMAGYTSYVGLQTLRDRKKKSWRL